MSRISFDGGFTFKDASELTRNEVDLAWSLRSQLDGVSREELDTVTKSEQCRHFGVAIYWVFYKGVFERCNRDLIFDAFENFNLTIECDNARSPYRIGYNIWNDVPKIAITVSSKEFDNENKNELCQ